MRLQILRNTFNLINRRNFRYGIKLNKQCLQCGVQLKEELVKCVNQECSTLQPLTNEADYFALMNCQQEFKIDLNKLKRDYYNVQGFYHPDKLINMDKKTQSQIENSSTVINQAYDTLKNPLKRATYLLKINGKEIKEDEKIGDREFLFKMMEMNEYLEEISSPKQLKIFSENIQNELNSLECQLNDAFSKKEWDQALQLVLQYRYYLKCSQRAQQKSI